MKNSVGLIPSTALLLIIVLSDCTATPLDDLLRAGQPFDPVAHEARYSFTTKLVVNGQREFGKEISDALEKLQVSGGGTLQLPAGTFHITWPIVVSHNVRLQGAGSDKTVLDAHFSSSVDPSGLLPEWGAVAVNAAENVTLAGFTVQGNRARGMARHGIVAHGARKLLVRDVIAREHARSGLVVRTSGIPEVPATLWRAEDVLVVDSRFESNGGSGVRIQRARRVALRGVAADGNDAHGFFVHRDAAAVLLHACNATGNGLRAGRGGLRASIGDGVRVGDRLLGSDVVGVAVHDCMLVNNYRAPVFVNRARDVRVTDTICYGSEFTLRCVVQLAAQGIQRKDNLFSWGFPPGRCSSGKSAYGVCCNKECKQCGGGACFLRANADGGRDEKWIQSNCCSSSIKKKDQKCRTRAAPCVM